MRAIHDQVPGGEIMEDTALYGQMVGSASVVGGARLVVYGRITGDLTIESGGTAAVYGVVTGDLVNDGRLELYGLILGSLADRSEDSYIDTGPKSSAKQLRPAPPRGPRPR